MEFPLFSGKKLPWHRYWCPYPGTIHCGYSGAFLTDPEEQFLGIHNAHLVSTEALLPRSGPLILCGEPGMGKTVELERLIENTGASKTESDVVINVDFREIATFPDFLRLTFQTPECESWESGEGLLTLIVDGVDEGLAQITKFVEQLTLELRRHPAERLRLLLTCRTAEWPVTAQQPLLNLWKLSEDDHRIFELCPLRQEDVGLTAEAFGVKREDFITGIYDSHVEALASRPVTFAFLLRDYLAAGRFEKTHRDLYESGAQKLCDEPDPRRSEQTRRMRKCVSVSSLAERLDAAQEIAARLLLSGQANIEITSELSAASLDAIETALFTSVGHNRFAFVHRTLAECLASRRLAKLPTLQLRRLLCRRDDGSEHVVPQLAELAAWVAGYHRDFLEHLLRTDPAVLLRSDIARIQGGHKAELVEALLTGAEREEICDEREYRRFYSGLTHPRLADQLRPFIREKSRGEISRRLAFDIAEACKLPELVDDFFTALKDADEAQLFREAASDALCESIPAERLSELIPLAKGEVGADPQDSIRGDALLKLVPSVWTVRDALPCVHAPRDNSFFGSYERLLHYHLSAHLTHDDIAPVLSHLSSWRKSFDSLNSRRGLAEKAFCMGLERLDDDQIAEWLVDIWLTKSRNYHPFCRTEESAIGQHLEIDAIRRAFGAAVLNGEKVEKDDFMHILSGDWRIVEKRDLPWLLEAIDDAPTERIENWARAIVNLAYWDPPVSCWDLFMERRASIPMLETSFPLYLEINAPQSRKAKAQHLRRERMGKRLRARRKPLNGDRRIKDWIRAYRKKGTTSAWHRLAVDLMLKPEDTHYPHFLGRVVDSPGWERSDETQREEIREVARGFLLHHSDGYAEFGNRTDFSDTGFMAIDLLKDDVASDARLQEAVKTNWIHSITGWHSDDQDIEKELFAHAYRLNPEAAMEGLFREATEDRDGTGNIYAFRRAAFCWDDRLSKTACDFIEASRTEHTVESGLAELAELDRGAAERCAIRLIEFHNESNADANSNCLKEAMATIVGFVFAAAWPEVIRRLFSMDVEFSRSVLLRASERLERREKEALQHLSEFQLAEFYILLQKLFPRSEDKPASGRVSRRHSLADLRGSLLTALSARANMQACGEFLRLAAEIPEEATWLRWRYRTTLAAKRRSEWVPLDPDDTERLLTDPAGRLVNNEDDLLELVVESLERLQVRLNGMPNPAAEELWNHDGNGNERRNFRPKDEEFISDYVHRWLVDDIGRSGIVINREVQPIRGKRTDILVEAPLRSSSESNEASVSVTIEVKGCWNKSVLTAVQTQLVSDYLQPFGRTHGLYLVAWFCCSRWKGTPPSQNTPFTRHSLDTAQQEIRNQCTPFDGKSTPEKVIGFVLNAALSE